MSPKSYSAFHFRSSHPCELEGGGKGGAGLRGNETIERSDGALHDELAHLGLLHFAAADDLVDHELAVLRFVAAQGLAQRLVVGRRDNIGLARDRVVLLEAFHALDDALGLLDDLGHEFLPRNFPALIWRS